MTPAGGSDVVSRRTAALGNVFAALVFGIYAVVILWHRTPPLLGDLPTWEFSGHVLAWHLRGLADPFHALKHYPVPNSTLTVVLGLLMLVVSWAAACKIFLLLYLAIAYAAIRSLITATGASSLLWFILPGAVFLNLNLWWGLLAFQGAIALLFFLVAILVRRMSADRPEWPVGVLLVLLFFTHMVPFTFACVLLFFFSLQTGQTRLLRQLVLPVLLVLGYIAGRIFYGNVDSSAAPTRLLAEGFWLSKTNAFVKSFGFINPVLDDLVHSAAHAALGTPVFALTFALNLLLCVAVFVVLLRGAGCVVSDHPYAFIWMGASLAMMAFLLVPASLLGISDPGGRILQTVLPIALCFCRPGGVARLPFRVAAVCAVALAIAGTAVFVKVPWSYPSPQAARTLPRPMERLARAPYGYQRGFADDTAAGRIDTWAFDTGVLLNLRTNPTTGK